MGRRRPRGLVVEVDGACEGNHRKDESQRSAGIGLHFPDGQADDISEPLPSHLRKTNVEAEIEASRRALAEAREMGYRRVILRTDSEFVVNAMTEHWAKWLRNGFRSSSGKGLVNESSLKSLVLHEHGLRVAWLFVPREDNAAADRLAKQGAREYTRYF